MGVSYSEIMGIPTYERRFFIRKFTEYIEREKEAAEEAVEEEELSEESEEVKETELEEEEKEELEYVTKEEFKSAVEEIKGMIEKMGYKDKEEMKEEVIEEKEEKEELSAVAPEPVKHNPEAEVDNKVNFHIASNRTQTTKDRVFDKIFNNNFHIKLEKAQIIKNSSFKWYFFWD